MTDTFKVLAQVYPATTGLTDGYTVPGATQAIVSVVLACNQSGSDVKIRVSIAVAGAADVSKQYIIYDDIVPPKKTLPVPGCSQLSLGATDVIRVKVDTANTVSFNILGVEVT